MSGDEANEIVEVKYKGYPNWTKVWNLTMVDAERDVNVVRVKLKDGTVVNVE